MGGVVGLDLSLSRTGLCYVPDDWNGNRRHLLTESISTQRKTMAHGKAEVLARYEVERYHEIAKGIVSFVKRTGAKHVAKENYAYSTVRNKQGKASQSASVTRLAELGGVVLSQLLLGCHLPVVSVPVNSARKWLTGGLKRGNQKEQVERFLKPHGVTFKNYDEMDAFVVAYYWFGEIKGIRSRFLPQSEFDF